MTPIETYQHYLSTGKIQPDAGQQKVIEYLQKTYDALLSAKGGLFRAPPQVKGLYCWGSVGTGKTFIMDCFYHALPFTEKLRLHFHPFMQYVHEQIDAHKGQEKRMALIAKKIAKQARVLCLDEFLVDDIGDAMILAGLLEALFKQKICLVTTSNVEPDRLYEKGIQRQNFLPAIAMIKDHTQVLELSSHLDYRRSQSRDINQHDAEQIFAQCAQNAKVETSPLRIARRNIQVIKRTEQVIWCDFKMLCGVPRSQKDYIAIAKRFNKVIVSGIKPISSTEHDLITNLIKLVDVLYDAKISLILATELPVDNIYTHGKKLFAFARTCSRLLEMSSVEWEVD